MLLLSNQDFCKSLSSINLELIGMKWIKLTVDINPSRLLYKLNQLVYLSKLNFRKWKWRVLLEVTYLDFHLFTKREQRLHAR